MRLWRLIMPDFRSRAFWFRLVIVGGLVTAICYFWLMPCHVLGSSMLPTYRYSTFTFCNKFAYRDRLPEYGEIVVLKWADGDFLLKRVVGLPGDTIEFRKGVLYRNGQKIEEPYVKLESNWDLSPRQVKSGNIYVVGDNRSMALELHRFGQISQKRIVGRPLW